jgi:LacI family transcriptional regulator, galactose operon repressor
MAVTLATVAARAGVSPATVSRVLNNNYPVAAETRRRVEKAVRELDYVVNAHARALLHAKSGIIGLVLNEISDPFFGTIAGGVHAAAGALHRLVVTCSSSGDPEQEFAYIEMLRRQRADGVILVGSAPMDTAYRKQLAAHGRGLRSQQAPLVLVGRPLPTRHAAAVTVPLDHEVSAREATEHLISLGHRRIAHITGTPGRTIALEREKGYRDALAAAGIPVDERLVVSGDFGRESGLVAARALLDTRVDFTAVFTGNDLMAAGALAIFRAAGVAVPDDVSVASVDDIPLSSDLAPGLTTVRLPLTEAGHRAVSLAMSPEPLVRPAPLGHELIVRASTAPPRS